MASAGELTVITSILRDGNHMRGMRTARIRTLYPANLCLTAMYVTCV